MSLKSTAQFNPVRLAAAVALFGVALGGLIGLLTTAAIGAGVASVWAAGVAIFNAVFVHDAVTPNANVPGIVHDTIVSLAPFAPKVESVVVPVATSPLLDAPKVIDHD